MKTLFLTSSDYDIARASDILSVGGLVAFPTETVYGLGANAFNEEATKNIYLAKGRPSDNPLIVHIAENSQLDDIVSEIPDSAEKLINKFWPGPLTIVMKKSDKIPDSVSAGLSTIAVRMPSHPVANKLLKTCMLPIAAPSANTSGKPSPTLFKHVADDLNGKIEAIIDGGACDVGVESTIIDVTEDIPVLLRPGGITYEQLTDLLGEVRLNFEAKDGQAPKAPGMKYKHYAPKAEVYIIRGDFEKYISENSGKFNKIGIMTYSKFSVPKNADVKFLGDEPKQYAENLFAFLREFDEDGVQVIFAQDINDKGINLAVRNRLYKAAGYKIITEE